MIPFPYVLRRRMMASGSGSKDMASLAPASGVTYINGLTGLTAEEVSAMSALISNEPTITKDTTSSVYVDLGDLHRKFDIGNQVTLALNGTNYAFDIIGFNHDTLTTATAYGAATATGKAGMTLQMHDCFTTAYAMHSLSTNSGGWKNTNMRNSVMPTMNGYVPSAWQSVIKLVNKISGKGGGSTSGTTTVSDNCFLLAEIEVTGSATVSVAGEGSQYAYYKAGNSKVKKCNGAARQWWLRSPRSGSSSHFVCIETDGSVPSTKWGGNTNQYGVAFAFCV